MSHRCLEPLQIAGAVIPNRIFRPPHQLMMCPGGRVSEQFIAYHEERARGGAGLLILEASPVHPKSAAHPSIVSIWDDESIEGFTRFRRRIAETPAKVFIQIWHGGVNCQPHDGSPAWSASDVSGWANGIVPIPMTQWMIDEVVESYAKAAVRAAAAGLEGIEVHAAHGYLPQQFLSPAINRRTDKYGGSFENRARFTLEVMRAIRAAVPKGFAVGIRMSDELVPGLSTLEDNFGVMELLQQEDLVDFFDLSLGSYVSSDKSGGAMQEPAGYQVDYYQGLKSRLSRPLMVTGRVRSLDEADQILRSGDADMVGMVRAMIADPHLVRKTIEGKVDQVRPCIACNQRCIAGHVFGDVGCAVNPAAGRELTLSEEKLVPAATPRRIFVVGGGVAGMEAARTAALRGHNVVLCEASPNLGGKVRFVAQRAPKMSTFGDISFYLESELRRLGVEIRTNTFVEAADIVAEAPDVVIVATGAMARMDGVQRHRPGHVVQGVDKPHVRSSVDTLATPAEQLGKTAVVVDDTGHYEAAAVAEYLVNNGLSVTFVTRHGSFAPLMELTIRTGPAYRRMHKTGRFQVRTRALLNRIDDASVVLFDEYLDAAAETVPADTVVLVTYDEPLRDLVGEMEAQGIQVRAVGDALSPRYIENAIRDGYLAAIDI